MKLSKGGIKFISTWEGSESKMYKDVAGLWTIGIGHLLTPNELQSGKVEIGNESFRYRNGLTDEQITALFQNDSDFAQRAVIDYVKVPLQQHQFDMLTSLTFNIGVGAFRKSTLLKLLNRGNYEAIPGQLKRWVYSGGVKVQGLINRRAEAAKVWIKNPDVYSKYYDNETVVESSDANDGDYIAKDGDVIIIKYPLVASYYDNPNGDTHITVGTGV